ncbi:MAG: hypothetical protein HOY44_05820 [Maritimibacter sp.]|uniref:hypothetical protein n=1 Tax=Maritimibacter sp. TaxID=2003363 RepID=UPI001DAEDFAF|nr:hypothetical protein [Maritimibacter sp.]MBL6427025.1 hypothetical protein [Maritimibacter sp.]
MKDIFLALVPVSFAVVYATGAQFLSGYYDFFGINLSELSLSLEQVARGAAAPMSRTLEPFFVALSVGVFILVLFFVGHDAKRIVPSLIILSAGVFSLWLVYALSKAYDLGVVEGRKALATLPQFYEISDDPEFSGIAFPANVLPRLVVATSSTYYLYGDTGAEGERWVIRVPREETSVTGAFIQ